MHETKFYAKMKLDNTPCFSAECQLKWEVVSNFNYTFSLHRKCVCMVQNSGTHWWVANSSCNTASGLLREGRVGQTATPSQDYATNRGKGGAFTYSGLLQCPRVAGRPRKPSKGSPHLRMLEKGHLKLLQTWGGLWFLIVNILRLHGCNPNPSRPA